jgi:hypothetical protein
MISITQERFRFDHKQPDKIHIRDNALIFEDTIYQISNISYAAVEQWKRVEDYSIPISVPLGWLFLGSLMTAIAEDLMILILGFLMILVAISLYIKSEYQRLGYIYILILHFDSGFEAYFQSQNPRFLNEVVKVLQQKIENPGNFANYVANFVTNTVTQVNFVNQNRSINVGGNAHGSIFNSGSARDLKTP